MTRKMTILVDMDCTMVDTLDAWTDELALRYRVVRHKEDITDWDLKKAYPMLSDEQIFAPLYTKSMWQRVRPMPLAVESLWNIQQEGHRIVVVTSSPPIHQSERHHHRARETAYLRRYSD